MYDRIDPQNNLNHPRPVDITRSSIQTSTTVNQINKAARSADHNMIFLLRWLMVGMPPTVVLVTICQFAPVSRRVSVQRSLS